MPEYLYGVSQLSLKPFSSTSPRWRKYLKRSRVNSERHRKNRRSAPPIRSAKAFLLTTASWKRHRTSTCASAISDGPTWDHGLPFMTFPRKMTTTTSSVPTPLFTTHEIVLSKDLTTG